MIDDVVLNAALLVTAVLEDLDVTYVIGGSVASTVHGVVRTTLDVDLLADLRLDLVSPLATALDEAFYIDEAAIRKAIAHGGSFNLIHLQTMVKVDVFVPTQRAFDRQQLARRISEPLASDSPMRIWVLSAEDIILAKLDWYRQGGEVSERQWRDVLGVFKTQGARLDEAYLLRWAAELGVSDLLDRARDAT